MYKRQGASGTGLAGQGNSGSWGGGYWFPGGGGGAGGFGSTNPALGGIGIQCAINGTNHYWAGGGGGSGYSGPGGNGGAGGGGGGAIGSPAGQGGSGLNVGSAGANGAINNQTNVPGGNAGANTGGGGGGGSHYNVGNNGGSGGSGIVIVRYKEGIWSSSNTLIATVDANGVVTGVSAGTCDIIYTITGASGCVTTSTRSLTIQGPAAPPLSGIQTISCGSTTIFTANNPTGGNTVVSISGYRVHSFLSGTQNFTVPSGFNGNIEVMVVGGGGGGGSDMGGGGGAF